MANNTTLPKAEFGGDEFSNNLFSDLAPLLTLFGEQVTKQFLSMSLSQADNILLAMGPLGIMTVIVSAIRVGGVRQLKALVGRARESKSTAEQELLSSTSPDVCELWSGKEVVRLIGNPAGMKNLIIARVDGKIKVFDLAGAFNGDLLQSQHLHTFDPNSVRIVQELSDSAPNLALNVKNATAPIWELWLWAAVGVVLQAAALAFPGLLTYFWKLEKGGQPIAPYGYPCFLIGTLLVVVGVAACGHVIEGVTTEHNFTPNQNSHKPILKIVRLQRSCTVSDQHFSSYAIFNSPGDLKIRTSRLNEGDYSTLAAAATTTTVLGFIVQFIGLRALHWSATIIQLGVTLIMTGIRAYVRRGLATNPICGDMLDGHETAGLAMKILQEAGEGQGLDSDMTAIAADEQQASRKPLIQRMKQLFSSQPQTPIDDERIEREALNQQDDISVGIWELPTLRYPLDDYERFLSIGSRWTRFDRPFNKPLLRRKYFDCKNQWNLLFSPIDLDRILAAKNDGPGHPEADEVELHAGVQRLMPQNDRAVRISNQLATAIERMLFTLEESPWIQWRHSSNRIDNIIHWAIPVVVQTQRDEKKTKWVNFRVIRVEPGLSEGGKDGGPWKFHDRDRLYSTLGLWLYTLAERAKVMRMTEELEQKLIIEPILGPLRFGFQDTGLAYVRIVGNDPPRSEDADPSVVRDEPPHPLRDWLGRRIGICSSSSGICKIIRDTERELPVHNWPIFGAHVSGSFMRNYYIFTDPDTDLITQCAQEILSIFMLKIASGIEAIDGGTQRHKPMEHEDQLTVPRVLTNELFNRLGIDVIRKSLARDIGEALTLIIPAFAHYGLLPEAVP